MVNSSEDYHNIPAGVENVSIPLSKYQVDLPTTGTVPTAYRYIPGIFKVCMHVHMRTGTEHRLPTVPTLVSPWFHLEGSSRRSRCFHRPDR